jgi:hypothetical protein
LCITFVSTNRQQNYVGKRFFVIRLPRRHHPGFVSHDSPDLSLVGKAGSVERHVRYG